MARKNIKVINKGTIVVISILISIALVATSLTFFESKTAAYVLLGALILGLVLFLLVFIPQAQRIEFNKHGIQFYSYSPHAQCRTYFWNQIKDVFIKEEIDKKKVVVQLYRSGSNKSNPENYFERVIDPEVYGYDPEELKEIIKRNLSQPNVHTDAPDLRPGELNVDDYT